jgi:hypothetical protein
MKTKKAQNKHYRQGDVFIERIPYLPAKLKPVAREGGRLILAHGKTTGHSHGISTLKCSMFARLDQPGVLFLEVKAAKAEVTHDEHAVIPLPKGAYRVTRQREFSSAAVRRVED